VPDPTWAQLVKAIIVRRAGSEYSPEAIIEHCRARLASYKKPRIVEFTSSLPKTSVGFVDRAAVDAAFGGGGYPNSLGSKRRVDAC
jgi:acyl-CoA synthetase (AMP-forming)/AMP-acid ligase II